MIQTLLLAAALLPLPETKPNIPVDSSTTVDIEEVVVVASPKHTAKLRNTSTSVSLFSDKEMQSARIQDLSGLNGMAGNFFVPQYGSKLSSAIYIRGIGSRINTPAVAMYVNDAPLAEKSEYSQNFMDVDRIDVLRGPQGTLYGRNAMGGVIRLYTKNPFTYQGTDVKLSGTTRNEGFKAAATTYQKLSDKMAFSLGGFYETDKGFWHNDSLGHKVGGNNSFGGKVRFVCKPTSKLSLDFNAAYEYSDENGYPYFYGGSLGQETLPNILNTITANRESQYRRSLFSSSLLASYEMPLFIVSSVTGFRSLDDRMLMDQDFIYKDIYTLEQKQKSNTVTEEITLKSLPGKRWEWTGGLFGLYEALRTEAPVTFFSDGVSMLNSTIAANLPAPTITVTNPYTGRPVTQTMQMTAAITDPSLAVSSYFRTPVLNTAAFFQGTLHDIFVDRLSMTLGLRLDYEHQQINGYGNVNTNYNFAIPSYGINADLTDEESLHTTFKNDYTTLLPKVAVQYDFLEGRGNVYATVSKGMRAGGYNIQMYSDIMSTKLQNGMMNGCRDYSYEVLTQLAESRPAMKSMFLSIRDSMVSKMPGTTEPDAKGTITYKPEYCWNYEVGTHLNLIKHTLEADLSFFFMDIRNQQIAKFVESGLGRIMVNAGHSHSCGLEAALSAHLFDDKLMLRANYGYTHAEFRRYDNGSANYKGNFVPFIPIHNMGILADYTLPLQSTVFPAITFGANVRGMGRIYWTEANDAYQNFYATLGAHLLLNILDKAQLNLWGENLTSSSHKNFYFESMGRKIYQKGAPFQLGADLIFHF